MNEELLRIPKVDLHLHLDGSLRVDTVYELLNDKNITIEGVKKSMIAPYKCKDLNEYLKYFDLPQKVLQTESSLTRVTRELIEDLEKENVIYAEIRFAPMFHTKLGLTQEQVVLAVLSGMKNSNIKVNLILCCMRGTSLNDNIETINIAYKYYKHGVCALDLAGSEIDYPTSDYYTLFKMAKDLGIDLTIHAGETGDPNSIEDAINMGAKRIGHGIAAIKNNSLIDKLIRNKIVLEVCPTSNIQTNVIDNVNNHPIYELYKKGVLTTINTDNRTVSDTDLTKEYKLLLSNLPFTMDDIKIMNANSINSAFISEEERQELLNIIK